jgi:RNA polymerase sigma-70 factor (ECF subfamily)
MQNNSTLTEDELLQRLQNGDENAFTEIYNRYWQRLLAIGYYYTHDQQAAEDIVHEVMMSVWVRKEDVKINSLEAYLGTAIKFAVFKAIARDKKLRGVLTSQNFLKHFSHIEEKLDAKFLHEYLNRTVEELPAKARLVFTYSRYEGFSITQIAEKMDLSPKAVEYHLTKALKALKERLQKIKSFFL